MQVLQVFGDLAKAVQEHEPDALKYQILHNQSSDEIVLIEQ